MGKSTENKIIMVNSFKGGTGKTSVALANCVHNCTQNGFYKNIYFIDIIFLLSDFFGESLK